MPPKKQRHQPIQQAEDTPSEKELSLLAEIEALKKEMNTKDDTHEAEVRAAQAALVGPSQLHYYEVLDERDALQEQLRELQEKQEAEPQEDEPENGGDSKDTDHQNNSNINNSGATPTEEPMTSPAPAAAATTAATAEPQGLTPRQQRNLELIAFHTLRKKKMEEELAELRRKVEVQEAENAARAEEHRRIKKRIRATCRCQSCTLAREHGQHIHHGHQEQAPADTAPAAPEPPEATSAAIFPSLPTGAGVRARALIAPRAAYSQVSAAAVQPGPVFKFVRPQADKEDGKEEQKKEQHESGPVFKFVRPSTDKPEEEQEDDDRED